MSLRILNKKKSSFTIVKRFREGMIYWDILSSGLAERFESWLGHLSKLGIICPLGWNRVKVAAKWWLGQIPTVPLYSDGPALQFLIWCYCNIGLVQQRMEKPIEAKNIIDKSKGRKYSLSNIWKLSAMFEWHSGKN